MKKWPTAMLANVATSSLAAVALNLRISTAM